MSSPLETFEIESPGAQGAKARITVDCVRQTNAQTNTKATRVLLAVHGLSEHGGRYRHLARDMNGQFSAFYSMDLRGHGRSQGLRGDCEVFDDFVVDVTTVISAIQAREPGKPIILLAHSFGGLVALRWLLTEKKPPIAGVVLSAPLLGILVRIPTYKRMMAGVLLRAAPRLQITDEINPAHLSHDLRVVEAYINDRLIHKKITPRLYSEMTGTMDWVMNQRGPLSCPALFLVPGCDKVVSSSKTLEFFGSLKGANKQLREYPLMYHEVLNETDKEKVFADITHWLETPGVPAKAVSAIRTPVLKSL